MERYIVDLAPDNFPGLSPRERAVDDMFAMIKEDILSGTEAGAFNATVAPEVVPPVYDRYLAVLENDGYVPSVGFINGHEFPTGADLAVLVMLRSGFPYGEAMLNAGYDGSAAYPKVYALADRTAAYPAVANYLATSKTFYATLDSAPKPGQM